MGFLVGRAATRRVLVGLMASTCVAGGLMVAAAAPSQAADDYPWAWQGQCPIVPQAPIEEPAPEPTAGPGGKGADAEEAPPPPPPPPPVFDPVSGHHYDPRGPRPVCERRVWAINGSIGDPWDFVLRNCTSFVAWRLNTAGMDFHNQDRGHRWGNANNWDDTARALGHRVDDIPAIGAVAQTDEGRVGHVAIVTGIGPGTVTIEEYNHATPGGYGTRTVPVETFRYLHLHDLAPSPLIGSDRPLISVRDGQQAWTARVDDAGTLLVSTPGRRAKEIGTRGSFSPLAAPALALDDRGRPWVAATTTSGRVLAGTPTKRGWRLVDLAAAAPTSSPALALTRGARLELFTINADGTLSARGHKRNGRWTAPRPVGARGSWATNTAPVLGEDAHGRTWLVAVTNDGRTWTQRTTRTGWGRPQPLKGADASLTATPSLTRDGTGLLHLHQVGSDGKISVRTLEGRSWSKAKPLNGRWSPYASPAVHAVGAVMHLAAVTDDGSVLVRKALPGAQGSIDPGRSKPQQGDPTRSPSLVVREDLGLYVVSSDGQRNTASLLMRVPPPVEAPVPN